MVKLAKPTLVALVSALVCVTLIASACGGKPTSTSSGTSGSKTETGSVSASAAALAAAAHVQVKITASGFSPAQVSVKKGGRVVWSNEDKKAHAVQILGGASSGSLKAGAVASHVFEEPGTFDVADPMNPKATMVVVVK